MSSSRRTSYGRPLSRRSLLGRTLLGATAAAPVMTAGASRAYAATADSRYLFEPTNYIARGTVFTRSVASMPLASNSAQLSQTMASMPNAFAGKAGYSWLKTSANTESYTIPIYVMDSRVAGTPTKTFTVDHYECAGDPVVHNAAIPCPDHAQPAYGGDHSLAIYDVGTGILREYFHCAAITGGFAAATAGWTQLGTPLTPGVLASRDFPMQLTKGASSVVKMHNPLSQVGLREISAGVINHALSFTFADYAPGSSWPAKQGDGRWTSSPAPVPGQWFRLPPNLDLGKLNLNPLTLMVCRALQRYGGYAADHNMWCHSVNIESPFTVPGGTHANTVAPLMLGFDASTNWGNIVNDLPWHLTEWAPINWQGTAQAASAGLPLQYTGTWTRSVQGTLREAGTTTTRSHNLQQDATAQTGQSAKITWSGTMTNSGTTTRTYDVVTRVQDRGAPVTCTVTVNGTVVARMTSTALATMPVQLPAGTNSVTITFDLAAPTDAQRNAIVKVSSWMPRS